MKEGRLASLAIIMAVGLCWLFTAQSISKEHQASQVRQPSYSAWEKVANGMTKSQVSELLGQPTVAQTPMGPGYLHTWNYGTVVPQSETFPENMAFTIWFADDKVISKEDPFGGIFSRDGKPSQPKLIIPMKDQVFDHYPRVVDLRWYPCSGEYPMEYVVELDTLNKPGGWVTQTLGAKTPYLSASFGGMTKWRWRAKGKNVKGDGPWSEYRYFEFTQ